MSDAKRAEDDLKLINELLEEQDAVKDLLPS